MRKGMVTRFFLSGLVAIGLQILFALPVLASTSNAGRLAPLPPVPTEILLAAPENVQLGDPIRIVGRLKDQAGAGIANKSIRFSIRDEYLGQASTTDDGSIQLQVKKDIPAGTYWITAVFNGAHLLAPSTFSVILVILPAQVHVQTVPPLAGVTFQMDGRQFVSGDDGIASIWIDTIGTYRLDALIDLYNSPAKRIQFGRWSEESYELNRLVRVPAEKVVQVGLNVYHQVSQKYVDLDGFPVDPARISSIKIKSAQGDTFELKPDQITWLPASRVARRGNGLEETKLLYSVISVNIDGSNVVNQAQQRFYANPNDRWPISLLLYTLRINAKDGLFGSPVGKTANIEFPNGQIKNYPLDKLGQVEIHSLARGIYKIELTGTNGLNSIIPVALSRNQDVSAKVITYLDVGVVGCLGFALALGLILYGRPWLIHIFTKKKAPVMQEAGWTSIHEN
jgi:hypothetical protein